jgi:CRISPR-associated protein Cas1
MRLVVDGFGKYIGKENELIVVKEKGKVVRRVKPDELKQIIIAGKVSLSSDAIKLMLKNAVDVVFIDRRGEVTGRLMHPFIGTAKTRREQYLAYNDERGVILAKEFINAKLRNQISVLSNLAKARKDNNPELAERLMDARDEIKLSINTLGGISGSKIEDVREEIMGVEGSASQKYWNSLSLIFPKEYGFRERRGLEAGQTRYAQDIVNAMLNYGYAILHSECIRAVELAGLDPYAGFLHADRSGRTSIALDLMEEFRQQIVDRAVIKLVSYRRIKATECEMKNFVCMLNDSARKTLLAEVLKKFETKTQYMGMNLSYSSIILQQARRIASFLRGEKKYSGFWQGW